jgi:hypothetical protein
MTDNPGDRFRDHRWHLADPYADDFQRLVMAECLLDEAADEIERLSARVDELIKERDTAQLKPWFELVRLD